MRKILWIVSILLFIPLTACGKAHMSGIILKSSENEILISENLSSDEYEEIKDESVTELQNKDVSGEGKKLNLTYLAYDEADQFSAGDAVDVWIDGGVMLSYPGRAKAKKIVLKD